MDKFKKIDKEFCLTDETVNVYGYRCLTAGLLLDEVAKNPIGYFMHQRDNGVVVRWDDFRIDGTKLYATPVINLSHPQGEKIVAEIENGFLNAASVGHIVCLDASDDADLKKEGQTGPTVTKWFPREISLVDIPGNYNALANLFDENDKALNLADFVKPKIENMKIAMLNAVLLTALNLKDDSTEVEFNATVQNLVDKANRTDVLEAQLVAVAKEAVAKEVADLVDAGQTAKKLTKNLADKLAVDYAENPKGLKSLIDEMPAQVSVAAALQENDVVVGQYAGKSWAELYASDELETVRQKFPDLYEKLRKEKYKK